MQIVPIAHAMLVRVRRAHAVAAVIEDPAGQDGRRTFEPNLPGDGVASEFCLYGLEQVAREDGLVLPTMHLASIDDFAT
jgi:hypothetical protein